MATKKRYYNKKNFKKETDFEKASRLSQELFSVLVDILDATQNPPAVIEKNEPDIKTICLNLAKAIVKHGSRIDPVSNEEVCNFYCTYENGLHANDCIFTQAKAFVESNKH